MDTKLFVRKQAGGMFTVVDKSMIPGDLFFVDSANGTDGAGFGRNPDAPVATVDYAIGLCAEDNGDVILVMPNHAESISSATAFVADVGGVTIIGIGGGAAMPTLTLDTAVGATLNVTDGDIRLQNLKLLSAFATGITAGITIAAGGGGCHLDGIVFTETDASSEFLIGISIHADADDLIIENCRYYGTDAGTTSSIIAAAGGTDRTIIRNNYLRGDASAAAVKLDAAASTDLWVVDNHVINIDTGAGLGIAIHNSSNGLAVRNYVTNLKDTVVGITGTGMSYHENLYSNAVNAQGRLGPAADT